MRVFTKTVIFLLVTVLLFPASGIISNASGMMATITESTVLVNGKNAYLQAYTIEGSNYFKLRDIAMALTGTDKQFNVTYDGVDGVVNITSKTAYEPVGGELTYSDDRSAQPAAPADLNFSLDGTAISLKAYGINGNNYIKLRDVGMALNFGVIWMDYVNMIRVETSMDYIPLADTTNMTPYEKLESNPFFHISCFRVTDEGINYTSEPDDKHPAPGAEYGYFSQARADFPNTYNHLTIQNGLRSDENDPDPVKLQMIYEIVKAYYPESCQGVMKLVEDCINYGAYSIGQYDSRSFEVSVYQRRTVSNDLQGHLSIHEINEIRLAIGVLYDTDYSA